MSPHAILEAVRKGLFFLFAVWENGDRGVKPLAQGHRATGAWTWDLNLGLSDWKASVNSGFAETDGYCVPTPRWAKRFL